MSSTLLIFSAKPHFPVVLNFFLNMFKVNSGAMILKVFITRKKAREAGRRRRTSSILRHLDSVNCMFCRLLRDDPGVCCLPSYLTEQSCGGGMFPVTPSGPSAEYMLLCCTNCPDCSKLKSYQTLLLKKNNIFIRI